MSGQGLLTHQAWGGCGGTPPLFVNRFRLSTASATQPPAPMKAACRQAAMLSPWRAVPSTRRSHFHIGDWTAYISLLGGACMQRRHSDLALSACSPADVVNVQHFARTSSHCRPSARLALQDAWDTVNDFWHVPLIGALIKMDHPCIAIKGLSTGTGLGWLSDAL